MNFILHYDGARFDAQGNFHLPGEERPKSKTDMLAEKFSNIGALVIRYHLGQGQRAGLLQQAARPDYEASRLENPGKGGDQTDLFVRSPSLPKECQKTAKIECCAHATLGKSKVLNERAQPLVQTNQLNLCGEQRLWDLMHTTVWNCGINFSYQLNSQGFAYVCCPKGIGPMEHEEISKALERGEYVIESGHAVVNGLRLPLASLSKMQIDLDPENKETAQENGIIISEPESGIERGPLGWLIHKKRPGIVKQEMLEDTVRIIRIAKGGFYELSKMEQALLQAGRLKNRDGTGLFTNNQAFNAIYAISTALEKDFGFDADKLLGNSLRITYNRVVQFLSDPVNLDDFLTGPLLTEMTQSLKTSKASSERKELPLRFTNPFPVLLNNAKAIAYAFGIKDAGGNPILRFEGMTKEEEMADVKVNGQLALPSLQSGRHAAAILSTALIVSEEMFLEQLLKEGTDLGALQEMLSEMIEDPQEKERAATLLNHAVLMTPKDKLGLQYPESEPMVALIREIFHFDCMIALNEAFSKEGVKTEDALAEFLLTHSEDELYQGLYSLTRLAGLIQKHPRISAASQGSRGIMAGLQPLILKMAPMLGERLGLKPEAGAFHVSTKASAQESSISDAASITEAPNPTERASSRSYRVGKFEFLISAVMLARIAYGVFNLFK